MEPTRRALRSRRRFLRAFGGAGALALAGCQSGTVGERSPDDSTPISTSSATDASEPDTDRRLHPVEHEKRIGAHYYSWYTPGGETWDHSPEEPSLGRYDSADEDVINQHVKWALEHGVNWLSISWADEGAWDNGTFIEDAFLPAGLGREIEFSLLYESNVQLETDDGGRMDFGDRANRERLRTDFERFEERYFEERTYLAVDGRPVVTLYAAHGFTGGARGAFRDAVDAIDADPYLVAAVLGDRHPAGTVHMLDRDWLEEFDAVTTYNTYDRDIAAEGTFDAFVAKTARTAENWALAANHVGLGFVPNVIPGYDDTNVPGRDRPPLERDADGFRDLTGAINGRMDPELDAVLITSFNEWPEYTAVEPSESYGTTYLEIVEEELGRSARDPMDWDAYDLLELDFDRTVTPDGASLDLALMVNRMEVVDAAGEPLASYDIGVLDAEPQFVGGAYNPEQDSESGWGTWRWLGGPNGRTTIYLGPDIGEPAAVRLHGKAIEDDVSAEVRYNGQVTDHVAFGGRGVRSYTVSVRGGE